MNAKPLFAAVVIAAWGTVTCNLAASDHHAKHHAARAAQQQQHHHNQLQQKAAQAHHQRAAQAQVARQNQQRHRAERYSQPASTAPSRYTSAAPAADRRPKAE